jgi:hypothetical protein
MENSKAFAIIPMFDGDYATFSMLYVFTSQHSSTMMFVSPSQSLGSLIVAPRDVLKSRIIEIDICRREEDSLQSALTEPRKAVPDARQDILPSVR